MSKVIDSVGIVGFTGSSFDWECVVEFVLAAKMNDFKIPQSVGVTGFDLNRGRDFLTNRDNFEGLLLNHIFRWSQAETKDDPYKHLFVEECMVSPHHSVEVWVDRLLKSQAKLIVILGDASTCITAKWLGPLKGYKTYENQFESGRTVLTQDLYIKE